MKKSIYGLEWTLLYVRMFGNRTNRQHVMEAYHVTDKRNCLSARASNIQFYQN